MGCNGRPFVTWERQKLLSKCTRSWIPFWKGELRFSVTIKYTLFLILFLSKCKHATNPSLAIFAKRSSPF